MQYTARTMVAILALTGCTLKGGSSDRPSRSEIHDGDHDGHVLADDCDDEDSAIHPEAPERCDGIDNNCDGDVDGPDSVDGVEYWADLDVDGFGAGTPTVSCTQPSATVDNGLDCDDSRAEVNPAGSEYCGDSIDNDCDAGTTCTWEGESATSMADATIVADVPESAIGRDLAGAGDVDGDGVDDLLVGTGIEAAFLFLGPVTSTSTDHAAATLTSATGDERLGWRVLGIEDQPGDGYGDIAVSAPAWSNDTGRVYIVSGPISGTMTFDSVASTTIFGVEEGGYVGDSYDSGDVDGDDVADVVVVSAHDIYVFRGPVVGGDLSTADADVTISAGESGFIGGSIGCAGDLDGDGVTDLTMTEWRGWLWLMLGPVTVDRPVTTSDVRIETHKFPFNESAAVATAGDLDDDGLDDLAIAAYTPSQPGEVWLVSGPVAAATEELDAASTAMTTIRGDGHGDAFGVALDTSGDFDGDGADDVVVTAPYYYDGAGAAFVFHGPLSGTLTTDDAGFRIWGDTDEYAGALARYTGDLDGDGITELALSSRLGGDAWLWNGHVTLWYGGPR